MKKIKIQNYPRYLFFTFLEETDKEDLNNQFIYLSKKQEFEFEDEDFEDGVCYCFDVKEKKTRDYGILLVFSNSSLIPKDYSFVELLGTITHESIHILNKIFIAIGQDWDLENDEMEAYLGGYITEQIVTYLLEEKILQKWKKL